jgi:hypothetical protein
MWPHGGKITQFLKKWPKHTQSQKCPNISIQANLESQKDLQQTTFENLKLCATNHVSKLLHYVKM